MATQSKVGRSGFLRDIPTGKPTLADLVKQIPLRFCCPSAFFAVNVGNKTSLLATRLGMDKRTVQRWKAKWKAGELKCPRTENCVLESCPPHLHGRLKRRLKV